MWNILVALFLIDLTVFIGALAAGIVILVVVNRFGADRDTASPDAEVL
jgi:hypothetical protein